ncbi:MAG: TMEM175 family protein [Ktedonobacterales bacterium]
MAGQQSKPGRMLQPRAESSRGTQLPGPERLNGFSDAFFAIAITLLVLDLHVPPPSSLTVHHQSLLEALVDLWPYYLGFLLSFIIIGVVWSNHHALFSYIRRVNHLLILLNLLLLMTIAVLPFATALLAQYIGRGLDQKTAILVYSGTLVAVATVYNAVWFYVVNHPQLLEPDIPRQALIHAWRPYLLGPALYAIAFLLGFIANGQIDLVLCAVLAVLYGLPVIADRLRA